MLNETIGFRSGARATRDPSLLSGRVQDALDFGYPGIRFGHDPAGFCARRANAKAAGALERFAPRITTGANRLAELAA